MKKILSLVIVAMCIITEIKAQHIPDANFAKVLHAKYPNCIDEKDNLLPEAGSVTELFLENSGIRELSGIKGFSALKKLQINQNSIVELPDLPNTILELFCSYNGLTHFNHLPDFLKRLDCNHNELSSMPALPLSLNYIDLGNNPLIVFPKLPSTLTVLACNGLQLTRLPDLPRGLIELWCYDNKLISLPTLPLNLKNIDFSNNQFTKMPGLPFNLTKLDCSKNLLTVLSKLPANLIELNCRNNKLVSLPIIPAGLIDLDCSDNNISVCPALPPKLTDLNIANNNIRHITNIPSSLTTLICDIDVIDNVPSPTGILVTVKDASGQEKKDKNVVVNAQPKSLFEQLKTAISQPFVGHGKIYEYRDEECKLSLSLHIQDEYEQIYSCHVHGTFTFTITINGIEYTAIEWVKGVIDMKKLELELDFEMWKSKPDRIPNGTVCPLTQTLKMYNDAAHKAYIVLNGQAHGYSLNICPNVSNGGDVEYTSYPQ